MSYENIGLIGFGNWVKSAYIPFVNNFKNPKIKYVSTKTEKSLENAKKIFGNGAKYFLNYKELLKNKEIDLIILSVPDEIHEDLLFEILSYDVDCIFEMPLTANKVNSEYIIQKIKDQENLIIPNLEMSYLPIVNYLSSIIEENKFGKLLGAKLKLSANWWPGFSVYSSSPWYIDVLNKIFKATPVKVRSIVEKKIKFPTESKGVTILDYEKFLAEWEFNMESTDGLSVVLDLFFENKNMNINLMNSEIISENNKKIDFFEPYNGWPGMHEFLEKVFFGKNVRKKKYIEEIESLQKISNALELSMRTNQWVSL